MSQELGQILKSAGLVDEAHLKEALVHQRTKGIRLGEALVELGHVDETTVQRAVAKQQGLPFIDLAKQKARVSDDILGRVPEEFARDQGLLPLMEKGGRLVVAIDDQLKRILADQLEFMIGQPVTCALCTPSALKAALVSYYGGGEEESVAAGMASEGDESDAPIVRLVTRMFQDAVKARASDIHIEPQAGSLRVRLRVDGVLRDVAEHPLHLAAPLTSRLKIMGSMDIAEKRKPQDGRIGVTIDGREIDVRASILPTNQGETMVMRLLDKSASLIGLKELGFSGEDHGWFKRLIRHPHGIVLVTGPTGSGKTTTLYAALSELNRPDVKIITAEDPVEYHIAGINQIQVHTKVGLSFARILRSMLRAAPNVILVGEIRDIETAEVAIQAALTGHLVFSTLHTNDAPSALTRLIDMGVQPFLVSTAIQGVLAQRLVRRLCPECREAYQPDPAELSALGLTPDQTGGRPFHRPRGCKVCDGVGYRGRVGLFELFEMDSQLRDMTFQGENLNSLRDAALGSGQLRPLLQDGARKVMEGTTTVTEVLRVCRGSMEEGSGL